MRLYTLHAPELANLQRQHGSPRRHAALSAYGACRRGRRRLRRATAALRAGDHIELHYDPKALACQPPAARCLQDLRTYSLWYKPAGLLSQGNEYGDHCALTRQAEKAFAPPREVFLRHRLDCEARGLMLLAHTAKAAAAFSALFRDNQIQKTYRVQVLGETPARGSIDLSLDGKPAHTDYRLLSHDADNHISTLAVTLRTGRLHQIRRHLAAIGHPVMGDPRYGRGNKNSEGIRLVAMRLEFSCPLTHRRQVFVLDEERVGF